MYKDPFNQIIRNWPPKGVFVDLLEKCFGMNAGLWSGKRLWFWIFENFFQDLCDLFEVKSGLKLVLL